MNILQTKQMFALEPLASFPGLPRFYLPFTFTIIHRSGEKQGRPGSIHHVSGREGGRKGAGGRLIFNYIRTKLESEFLTSQDEEFPSR